MCPGLCLENPGWNLLLFLLFQGQTDSPRWASPRPFGFQERKWVCLGGREAAQISLSLNKLLLSVVLSVSDCFMSHGLSTWEKYFKEIIVKLKVKHMHNNFIV